MFPIVYELSGAQEHEGKNGTDIGELPILEDEEVVFCAQLSETVYQRGLKVLDDIYMCLHGYDMCSCVKKPLLTFTRQIYGPTMSMILRKSACFVTSTLTHRLLFLRSIVSSNPLAAGLACFSALCA